MSWAKIVFIVAAVISGLFGLLFFRNILRGQDYSYSLTLNDFFFRDGSRNGAFYVGASLIFTSLAVSGFSNFWLDILDIFALVTGVQMVLGAFGIRLELFSNNPAD